MAADTVILFNSDWVRSMSAIKGHSLFRLESNDWHSSARSCTSNRTDQTGDCLSFYCSQYHWWTCLQTSLFEAGYGEIDRPRWSVSLSLDLLRTSFSVLELKQGFDAYDTVSERNEWFAMDRRRCVRCSRFFRLILRVKKRNHSIWPSSSKGSRRSIKERSSPRTMSSRTSTSIGCWIVRTCWKRCTYNRNSKKVNWRPSSNFQAERIFSIRVFFCNE